RALRRRVFLLLSALCLSSPHVPAVLVCADSPFLALTDPASAEFYPLSLHDALPISTTVVSMYLRLHPLLLSHYFPVVLLLVLLFLLLHSHLFHPFCHMLQIRSVKASVAKILFFSLIFLLRFILSSVLINRIIRLDEQSLHLLKHLQVLLLRILSFLLAILGLGLSYVR